MKKISIISPVFGDVYRIPEVSAELLNFFKGKYNFEVFYYYTGKLKVGTIDDYHFNFIKAKSEHNFNDCVTDAFNRVNGDCVIVADINNEDYLEYITKLLIEWEAKAQVVLVKKNPGSGFFGKIKNFFCKVFHKIYDMVLGIAGLNADFSAYKNFQLFSSEVVEVISSFPEKNYYLRNFDCWVDYRVSILYSAKKIKVKNKSKVFTKDLIASLVSFALMLSCLALVIFGSSAVSEISKATFMLLGVGISACLGVFAIFCLYRWFIYRKTFLKINIK